MKAKYALALAAAAASTMAPVSAVLASRTNAPIDGESNLTGTGNLFVIATVVVVAAAVAFLPEDPASP